MIFPPSQYLFFKMICMNVPLLIHSTPSLYTLMIFQLFATSNNSIVRILEEYVILYSNDFISVGEIHKGRTNRFDFNLPDHFPKRTFHIPKSNL